MINVKKWLAALLTAAMVISGSGFASLAVYAEDPEPVGGWTISRAGSGTEFYSTLQEAYNDAAAGEVIFPSEHLTKSDDQLTIGSRNNPPKLVTINTQGVDYDEASNISFNWRYQNYNNGHYCLGIKDDVVTVGVHECKRVVFNWDYVNVNATATEYCDNCGKQAPRQVNPNNISVSPAIGSCIEDTEYTYTATYRDQVYPRNTWTDTRKETKKATGKHTYRFVPGTAEWVIEGNKVKKDVNGNPVAKGKIDCVYGDIATADRLEVTLAIKEAKTIDEATCQAAGRAEYTFVVPVSQLPADAGNTEDVAVGDTLRNETEKVTHAAGTPNSLEYAYTDASGEQKWTDSINDADDAEGVVTYRTVYQCKWCNALVRDEGKTLSPKGEPVVTKLAQADKCYQTVYSYDKIHYIYNVTESGQDAKDLQPADKTVVTTTHRRDPNEAYHVDEPPTCGKPGRIRFKCLDCGIQVTDDQTDPLVLPTGEHVFEKDAATGEDKIHEKKATCTEVGYEYKVCTKCKADHWALPDDQKTGAESSVIVKELPKTGHNYVVVNADDVAWYSNGIKFTKDSNSLNPAANVTCVATVACKNEGITDATGTHYGTQVQAYYYSWAYDAAAVPAMPAPDEAHVYEAITPDVSTTDCTAYDKITYTVKDLKDLNDKPITVTANSMYYGKHTDTTTLNWSQDGKEATLSCVCGNDKCIEYLDNGYHLIRTKDCDVSSAFNEDGSIKYTATCEGYDLTDNTFDVFDLREAVVTTDKVLDSQVVLNPNNRYTPEERAKLIGLSVKVNGVELDKDVYQFTINRTPQWGNNPTSATVTIAAKSDTKVTIPIVGTKTSEAAAVKTFDEFEATDYNVLIDGLAPNNVNYTNEFQYDGNDHTVELVFKDQTVAKDAVVKYAAVKPGQTPEEDDFTLDAFTQKDVITCDIFVSITKEEYRPYTARIVQGFMITPLTVYVYIDNCTVKQGQTPEPNYFIGDINHRPIGVAEDVLGIRIATTAGKPLTGLEPGQYVMTALSDNKSINIWTRGGLNYEDAPILTIEKDATAADKMAADKVAGMIDALNESSTPEEIKAASDAYNALTPAQQKLVDAAKVEKLDKAVADSVTAMINALNESSTPEQVKAAWDAYNALTSSQKTLISKEVVTKVTQMAEAAGLVQKNSSITIKNKAKAKVKRGKAIKVNYTKVGDGKVTIKISGNKKVKKFFKVKGNKIKVAKKAKKGKYKVKVTVSIAATQNYKAAKKSKTIKVTVK